MRALFFMVFGATCWLVGSGRNAARPVQQSSGCAGPDWYSEYELRYLRPSLATTDTALVAWRLAVGLSSVSDPSSVYVVTDSVTCARGSEAFRQERQILTDSLPLAYVIRAGDRYVVSHPSHTAGEFAIHVVFDTLFQRQGMYVK